jgi:hypothetical protein
VDRQQRARENVRVQDPLRGRRTRTSGACGRPEPPTTLAPRTSHPEPEPQHAPQPKPEPDTDPLHTKIKYIIKNQIK